MRLRNSTLGALLAASITSTAVGCAGPATESGAGAAFMNGADEAEFQAGIAAQQAGDQAEAERRFKRALAANPNYLSARISLGNLLLAQGRIEEASAAFDAALTTRASSIDAQLGAAEARLRLNRCDEASALSRQVVAQGKRAATPAHLHRPMHCDARTRRCSGEFPRGNSRKRLEHRGAFGAGRTPHGHRHLDRCRQCAGTRGGV